MTAGDARSTSEAGPPHVLVVDDAAELLDLFVELLEGEGYRVSTSRDLLSMDDISAIAPDVIVHDLIFSGYDEVLRMLTLKRQDPRLVPVILCTADTRGLSDLNTAAQLENLGVPVILKLFAIESLLNVVAEALARPVPSTKNGHVPPQHSIGDEPNLGSTGARRDEPDLSAGGSSPLSWPHSSTAGPSRSKGTLAGAGLRSSGWGADVLRPRPSSPARPGQPRADGSIGARRSQSARDAGPAVWMSACHAGAGTTTGDPAQRAPVSFGRASVET